MLKLRAPQFRVGAEHLKANAILRLAGWIAIAIIATTPAWIVRHLPLQDFPTHLAILRVVHSYGDPAFGLQPYFVLNLFGTQYLMYYLVGSGLAYLFGVFGANTILVSSYLGGTVLATRSLARALGKDERVAIFAIPFLVNSMFMYGFLPFLFGIPFSLFGIALSIKYFEKPSIARGCTISALATFLVLEHLFPFLLFGLGFIAVFPWNKPKSWLRAGAPVVPALALLGFWMACSTTGKRMATSIGTVPSAPIMARLKAVPRWTIDVFGDLSNTKFAIAIAAVATLSTALSLSNKRAAGQIAWRYAALPIVCIILYLIADDSVGDIWLVGPRLAILAIIAAVPLVGIPTGVPGQLITGLAAAIGTFSIWNTCKHFIEFERKDVGNFEGALSVMEPGKKVAGLIYDHTCSIGIVTPFLHFVSYYQAEKGGLAQWSMANVHHLPFQFRPDRLPPQGVMERSGWEWSPQRVTIRELYPFYDYVLTRGAGFHPPAGTYHIKWRDDRWTVWEKGTS